MDLVCPNTPRMSSSSRGLRVRALMLGGIELSLCFEDVVLGFGANLVTALVFIVLQATKRSRRRVTVTEAPLKRLLHVLPSVGVCLSTYDVVLLIRKSLQGHAPEYHKWLFSCSQLVSWMMVMLSLKCEYHKVFFYNGIFCFWWIVKTLLLIPRLLTIFSSSEAIVCVEVGLSFINELIFGLLVNWVRLMSSHNDGRAFNHLDEALLPHDMEKNDDHSKEDVLNDGVGFLSPLLLNRLLRFVQQGSGHRDGYILAVSLGLVSTFKSLLDTQYSFQLNKLKLQLRSSIMTIIYHKCLQVSLAERSRFSEGEIQTFMSVDADRTVNLCNSFHDLWSLPLQIGVALYLLYTQVRFAFVSGVVITVLLIPVNKWISSLMAKATEKMMKQKDERIRSAGELIKYIRTLKMYNWEDLFSNRLQEKRSFELDHLSTRKYLDAWCVFFWATTPTLFSLFTFGLFSLMGHPLNAATVFTCVALFNTLISPLNSFPWVINGLIDAMISARRLSNFLSCPELKSQIEHEPVEHESDPLSMPNFEGHTDINPIQLDIVLKDAKCRWSSSNEEAQNIILDCINLSIPKGYLIAVTGEVGSGKSSLLNSVLGEMHLLHGVIDCRGTIAYVPQVPWIMSGSVRDNILFGEEFDAARYSYVLHACALDIDISFMVGGDLCNAGEKGVNLSGGQRARLALARAIYQSKDIYFLDDVLSAVDAQVSCWILEKAIMGPLMNQRTRVICTHNTQQNRPSSKQGVPHQDTSSVL